MTDRQKAEAWADAMLEAGTHDPEATRDSLIVHWHEQHIGFRRALDAERNKSSEQRFMGGPEGPAGGMGAAPRSHN